MREKLKIGIRSAAGAVIGVSLHDLYIAENSFDLHHSLMVGLFSFLIALCMPLKFFVTKKQKSKIESYQTK